MSTWLAAAVALGAIAATYFFCVRPAMRGGHCAAGGARGGGGAQLDRQLAELREEVRVLRAQDMLDTGPAPPGKSNPPGEA